jgi:hypothetical protein
MSKGLIGAGRHERSAERLYYRNGCRERSLDTRLGSLQLRIPRLRQGSYLPPYLEPGWDINPRVLGTVPKEARVATLKGFHWVTDAHYMVVPKGVSDEHLAVVIDLMAYLLTPEA